MNLEHNLKKELWVDGLKFLGKGLTSLVFEDGDRVRGVTTCELKPVWMEFNKEKFGYEIISVEKCTLNTSRFFFKDEVEQGVAVTYNMDRFEELSFEDRLNFGIDKLLLEIVYIKVKYLQCNVLHVEEICEELNEFPELVNLMMDIPKCFNSNVRLDIHNDQFMKDCAGNLVLIDCVI